MCGSTCGCYVTRVQLDKDASVPDACGLVRRRTGRREVLVDRVGESELPSRPTLLPTAICLQQLSA
jgi:hypothetical protein